MNKWTKKYRKAWGKMSRKERKDLSFGSGDFLIFCVLKEHQRIQEEEEERAKLKKEIEDILSDPEVKKRLEKIDKEIEEEEKTIGCKIKKPQDVISLRFYFFQILNIESASDVALLLLFPLFNKKSTNLALLQVQYRSRGRRGS